MILVSGKIHLYDRIMQNGFKTIKYKFKTPMQILLGSNGSGKSSLFEQWSPLPPKTASEYKKGGYKRNHFLFNDKSYVCASDFGEYNGHYFEVDSEVLNNWGTAIVQKQLIEEHFGLTQDIFDVLSSAKKFTSMSPTERRDWVMRLSNLDINPLMSKFLKAKEKLKEAKVWMNKNADRLKIEEKNLISEEQVKDLDTRLKNLKEEFEYYSKFGEEITPLENGYDLDFETKALSAWLDETLKTFTKVPTWMVEQGATDLTQLNSLLAKKESELEITNKINSELLKELGEINKIAVAKAELEENGIEDSEKLITDLKAQLDQLTPKLRYGIELDNPNLVKTEYMKIYETIRGLLFELPNNEDFRFNSKTLLEGREKLQSLQSRITELETQIYQKEHKISHINSLDVIECPKCTFAFKKGFDESDIVHTQKELENLFEQKELATKSYLETEEFVKDCGECVETIKTIYNNMKYCPSNEVFWEKLKKLEFFKNPAMPAIEMMETYIDELDILIDIESINKTLNAENDILLKAKEALELVNNANEKNLSKIDEKVYFNSQKIEKLNYEIKQIKTTISRQKFQENTIRDINLSAEKLEKMNMLSLKNDRAEFIKKTKYEIVKEINIVEEERDKARTKQRIYNDIKSQHDAAKAEYDEYKIIVDNLSPNTGLIADIMTETNNNFVNNLNSVIESVWTSPLEVLPCINKKNDLDWKFPVRVDDGIIRGDVAKTSTSQKDIINLSFQLITNNTICDGKMPLFLDELGSSMDDQHRINMMRVIGTIVETNQCSQLFFISHYAAMHDQFDGCDVIVLNKDNILELPKVYNENVEMY